MKLWKTLTDILNQAEKKFMGELVFLAARTKSSSIGLLDSSKSCLTFSTYVGLRACEYTLVTIAGTLMAASLSAFFVAQILSAGAERLTDD